MEETVRKKAELILGGDILIPSDFVMPFRLSRSTAGPGAGKVSAVFEFNGMRVKKAVSSEKGEFRLKNDGGKLSIWKNDVLFLENVTIQPVVFHSPNHAFFNLDQRCMFRCVFCASPLLDRNITKDLTDEKITEMIRKEEKRSNIPAIALTSGVVGSIQESVDRMVACVERLHSEFPDKIIGVEPYVDRKEQIDALFDAGANEFKLNIETATEDIFKKVCPDLDRNSVFDMLSYAVKVFGKGRVASNLIYGLGETDGDVVKEMERLASIGCIPGLRALKITEVNRSQLENVLGKLEPVTWERMIFLANEQKEIMGKYGLTTETFETMCFKCQCCDIVPFVNL